MGNSASAIKKKNIIEIVKQHYETENQSKSLTQVWRHYVYPIYPMSLRNFRRYVKLKDVLIEFENN